MPATITLLDGSSSASLVLLVLAAVATLADWTSVAKPGRRMVAVEYVAKPAVPLLLMAAVLAAPVADESVRWVAAAALLFSCGGDVALMLPDERGSRFIMGLSSFLVAQLLFATGFLIQPHGSLLLGLAIVVVIAGWPSALVLRSVARGAQELIGPVAVYVAAITLMAGSAVALGLHDPSRRIPAIVGGLAFVASDMLLAINRFVQPIRHEALVVHVTYHVALFGLTIGMLGLSSS